MQHMHVESQYKNLNCQPVKSKSEAQKYINFPMVSRILSKQNQSWTDCSSEFFSKQAFTSMPYYTVTFYFYPFN